MVLVPANFAATLPLGPPRPTSDSGGYFLVDENSTYVAFSCTVVVSPNWAALSNSGAKTEVVPESALASVHLR